MKVRYLVLDAGRVGGGVRSVVTQANALAEGHDVELISVYRTRPRPAFAVHPRVRQHHLLDLCAPARHPILAVLLRRPSRYVPADEGRYRRFNLASDIVLRRYLRSLQDGVLVTARPGLTLLAARFATGGVVRVGEDHMNLRSYRSGVVAAMKSWYPQLDALVTLTDADTADQRRTLGPHLRVERIPNAVPARTGPRAPLDRPVVIAAGRLTAQKGFDRLVDAFAGTANDHPAWQLHIYGTGPARQTLQQRIERRELGQRARLMGHTNRLADALADASLYVLSSRYEGLPMVLLEAMACGLPAIAFDCHTGPRDIITHGRDGVLVPPGDVRALADAIGRLMDCAADRRRLGAEAHRSVARFDVDEIAPRWVDLFADLLARHRPSTAARHRRDDESAQSHAR